MSILMKLVSPLTKTPNQGASTSVFCATHEPAEDLQSRYFSHCKEVGSSTEAKDPVVAGKLWALSEAWCDQADTN
jgi:WW domain-containing oxidoreductase